MSDAATQPLVMKHETQPDWGNGLVVQNLPLHWVIFFERAGEKKFLKEKAKVLVPVTLPAGELAALTTKALGRRPRAAPGTGKPKKARAEAARFLNFDAQLTAFEKIFPGGFAGDKFVAEERGAEGVEGKTGYKTAAIRLAQAELSKEAFEKNDTATLFASARKVLAATNIVFPIEGGIPFGQLDEEGQKNAVEGLRALLHGESDYATRIERFPATLSLKDKNGPKKVTWPMATIFGGLFDPKTFIVVKPTAFASQAATLALQADRAQPVTAVGYRQFEAVVLKTRDRLVAAGHQPRDLMDVYSFIWRTHAEKPAATP